MTSAPGDDPRDTGAPSGPGDASGSDPRPPDEPGGPVPASDAAGRSPSEPVAEGDRVRFCSACGQVVPFAERTCPSCGHHEALETRRPSGVARPCEGCGTELPATLLFCDRCGAEQYPDVLADAPERRPPEAAAEAGAAAVDRWAMVLTLIGPIALLAAAAVLYFSAAD